MNAIPPSLCMQAPGPTAGERRVRAPVARSLVRKAMRQPGVQCGAAVVLFAVALLFSAAAIAIDSPRDEAAAWADARQLVLVVSDDWNSDRATLQAFERNASGPWKPRGQRVPVTLGRAGSAWGLGLHGAHDGPQKREGDGRSPAGVFHLGGAFGYAGRQRTKLDYTPMQDSHWCVDVAGSPLYNRIVDSKTVGEAAVRGSTEPMRRDIHANGDRRYKSGFVILHNDAQHPDGGSCIFAHLWRSPAEATAGCTAMDEAAMQSLLTWLDPAHMPVFVLLPQAEYARLADAWQLPVPAIP